MMRSNTFWRFLLCCAHASVFAFVPTSYSLNKVQTALDVKQSSDGSTHISFDSLQGKNVLVVGGSGRVGGSVVCQLLLRGAKVSVGGTNIENFLESKARWSDLFTEIDTSKIDFVVLDRENSMSVDSILKKRSLDLVVHTAGPFQGKATVQNGVINACVDNACPYIDVCDDYCTAMAAKSKYSQLAQQQEVPCIVSTGCWPGVSSLMAKSLSRKLLETEKSLTVEDLNVNFSFFTAGSGGAGATLLVATFLILAEEALTVVNGRRKPVKAMVGYENIDFGKIIGTKPVAPLNLLETASVHDVLGAGNVKSLFGTAPGFWNTLLGLMAQLPSSLLSNEEIMTKLALFSLPIVRIVDFFAGATNAMRCDITSDKIPGLTATAIYGHENLEPCVGECVVAFCAAILSNNKVAPGVWFPEEAIASDSDITDVLSLASVGAHTKDVGGIVKDPTDVWGSRSGLQKTVEA